MKMIMAIIKPAKIDAVREALLGIGVQGLTTTEVQGFGRQRGHTEIYRGAEYAISYVPKIKIEVAVSDEMADRVVDAIRGSANSQSIGDGKIFIYELGEAVRIRTGETGSQAL
jgi:nitrogen regulatory protein P-II 2